MLQAFFLEVVIDNKINQYFNIDIDVSISIDYPSPSDTGIDTGTRVPVMPVLIIGLLKSATGLLSICVPYSVSIVGCTEYTR